MTNTFQTGSLMNLLASGPQTVQPEVGMGATELCWTDRHACTIVGVQCNRKGEPVIVVTQRDTATRIDKLGMSDCQTYAYTANPNGRLRYWKRRKDGSWCAAELTEKGGYAIDKHGARLAIGRRDEYYDFSF